MKNISYLSVNNKMPLSLRLSSISKNINKMTIKVSTTKICAKCKVSKPLNEFHKHKRNKDGLKYHCKECRKSKSRSVDGLINRIYNNQKSSSKKRGHNPPDYTFEELKAWMLSQPNFKSLYSSWVYSGYNTKLRPSCDREKSNLPYALSSINLMTWENNRRNYYTELRSGKAISKSNPQKAVVGVLILSRKEEVFISMNQASRKTKTPQPNIWKCCNSIRKSAGGYEWRYV